MIEILCKFDYLYPYIVNCIYDVLLRSGLPPRLNDTPLAGPGGPDT